MEDFLNQNTDIEPRIKSQDDLALHDLKVKEINSNQQSYSDASFDDLSTAASKTGSIEPSLELDDPEEVLKQRVTFYTTYQSPLDALHTTMATPVDNNNTLFSTMKVVSSDIEMVKENLSYYQYKLYQKFSVKISDLVRLETLGKGAFGEVTRVFNKADREFYALKEIKRQSFKKPIYFESAVWTEIQNLLKVMEPKDPLLLKTALIDFDEDEQMSYLLMEFGGGTLEDYAECMRHYGLSWTEVELEFVLSQLISQVLKLKKISMYHRDIKPSNVIIGIQDNVFKLSDLGCACITKEGVQRLDIAGTPHFMSPEIIQAIMKREQVVQHDPLLSDLYSIGVTILALLEPNFKRNDVNKIMDNIVKPKYPVLYPIMKDLLGYPENRNAGLKAAAALKLSLKTYREFNIANLGPKYKLYLYCKVLSKNKDIDTSFYFDMFILDDALTVIKKKIYLLTQGKKPEDQNLEEVMWRLRLVRCYYMQMNYYEALKELEIIMQRKELKSFETPNTMTQAKALLWLGMVKVKFGRMEEAIDHIMHCLGIRIAEYGEVHDGVCEVFWQLGDTKILQDNLCGAAKAFQKCVEIGEKLDPKQRQFMAKALNNLGAMSTLKGDYKKALELYERARETAREAHGEHHPAVADQDLGIAYIYIILGKSQEALSLYDKALELKVRWYGESNPEVADAYTKIARGYDRLGQYSKVLELLSKSVSIWKKINGEESQELADVYQLIGDILCKKGQYKQSLKYSNKVISIKEKHLGKNHPWLAGIYVWHARLCEILRLSKEKEKSMQKFLAIDFDRLELNVDSIRVGFNGARLLAEEGKVEKAWEYVQKAYEMCTNLAIAKNSKTYANYCEAVGRLKMAEGKYQEALEKAKEALNIRFMIICKDHDIEAGLFSLMGDLNEALKQNEEALEWRRRCINIIEKYLSKESLLLVKELVDLSRVLVKLGKKEEAKESLEETKNLIEKVDVSKFHPLVQSQIDLSQELEGKPSPFANDYGEKYCIL